MQILSALLVLLFAGCTTATNFHGPPEFQAWMQNALAHPDGNAAFQRFSLAYRGKPEGLHVYFVEASRQAESPEINVEAGESLTWELQTILHHVGDAHFAAVLAVEPARVRSALSLCFSGLASPAYPQTTRLLTDAPKADFPMLQTYRGEYHPVSASHR